MSLEPISTELEAPVAQHANKYNGCHRCDIITTLVVPILLAVSASLTIYYAVHPIAPLVPIYGDFSLSLPLLICGSTGLALTIVLIVQIARRGKVKVACGECVGHQVHTSPTIQHTVRTILQPGKPNGQTVEAYRTEHAKLVKQITDLFGQQVEFPTRDNVLLRGYWHQSSTLDAPTVIFFYGNMMTAERTANYGIAYKSAGFNVLLFNLRGYGNSDGISAGPNAELEAYFDAEAALRFVQSQKVDRAKIVAHGFSLGGSYAAALGYFFDISCVILHNTFTSCLAVVSHASKLGPEMIVPALTASYLQGSAPALQEFPEARDLKTDGFDTLSKVKQMRSKILVIQGTNDHLMPMEFGAQLVQARYPDPKDQELYLINIPCGHELEPFFLNEEAMERFSDFFMSAFPSHPWTSNH